MVPVICLSSSRPQRDLGSEPGLVLVLWLVDAMLVLTDVSLTWGQTDHRGLCPGPPATAGHNVTIWCWEWEQPLSCVKRGREGLCPQTAGQGGAGRGGLRVPPQRGEFPNLCLGVPGQKPVSVCLHQRWPGCVSCTSGGAAGPGSPRSRVLDTNRSVNTYLCWGCLRGTSGAAVPMATSPDKSSKISVLIQNFQVGEEKAAPENLTSCCSWSRRWYRHRSGSVTEVSRVTTPR